MFLRKVWSPLSYLKQHSEFGEQLSSAASYLASGENSAGRHRLDSRYLLRDSLGYHMAQGA